jgi:hypothetical protein
MITKNNGHILNVSATAINILNLDAKVIFYLSIFITFYLFLNNSPYNLETII